jgi:hypothetical protein
MTGRFDADAALAEARALGRDDAERADALRRQIAAVAPCPAWAAARVELAEAAFAAARYGEAAELAASVLAAPDHAPPAARAVAAVLHPIALDQDGGPFDRAALAAGVAACVDANEPFYAAAGLSLAASAQLDAGDRAGARASLERAADLYDRAGSAIRGPGVLHRLVVIALEDARVADARRYLDRALAQLAKFPAAGAPARTLERKLREIRAAIDQGT